MWKTVDIICYTCESQHIQMIEVPYGAPLPNTVTCEKCGADNARRLISATVHKAHVEEAIHGTVIDGRIVSRETGAQAAKEQNMLQKRLKAAKKAGDATTAREVQKEYNAKVAENKKKLTGG